MNRLIATIIIFTEIILVQLPVCAQKNSALKAIDPNNAQSEPNVIQTIQNKQSNNKQINTMNAIPNSAIQGRPLGSPPKRTINNPNSNSNFSGDGSYSSEPLNIMPISSGRGWLPVNNFGAADMSLYESRITRLEQICFGSSYPEHEVEDRLDHIEREVFAQKNSDLTLDNRLIKLESKLIGQSAFGQAQSKQQYSAQMSQGQYPAQMPRGQYPAQMPQIPQGQYSAQMPQGQYPAQMPQGQYPAQMPQGQYPAQMPQGQYPAQMPQGQYPAQMPQGQYPAQMPQGQYPAQMPQGQYPAQMSQGQYPAQMPQGQYPAQMPQGQYPAQMLPQQYQQGAKPNIATKGQVPQNSLKDKNQLENNLELVMNDLDRSILGHESKKLELIPQPIKIEEQNKNLEQNTDKNANSNSSVTAKNDKDNFAMKVPEKAGAGDYFGNISSFANSSYARWNKVHLSLHLPEGSPEPWNLSLLDAISEWGRYVSLKVAENSEPADIEIAWINHLAPKCLGQTNLEVFNGRMRVTIYLLRPSYYLASISEKSLSKVAMHEIGHALGIFGHSNDPQDLMYPLESVFTTNNKNKSGTITSRDLNTLKKIYLAPSLPPGYQSPHPMGWSFLRY